MGSEWQQGEEQELWRHCPASFPQNAPAFSSLGLSVGKDMAGENGCGGCVPEPPSLSPFTASVPLSRAPSSSSAVVPSWDHVSDSPRWTERRFGFNNMAGRTLPRGCISSNLWHLPLLTWRRGASGWVEKPWLEECRKKPVTEEWERDRYQPGNSEKHKRDTATHQCKQLLL